MTKLRQNRGERPELRINQGQSDERIKVKFKTCILLPLVNDRIQFKVMTLVSNPHSCQHHGRSNDWINGIKSPFTFGSW